MLRINGNDVYYDITGDLDWPKNQLESNALFALANQLDHIACNYHRDMHISLRFYTKAENGFEYNLKSVNITIEHSRKLGKHMSLAKRLLKGIV